MPDPSYYPLFLGLGMTIMVGGFLPFTGHWIVCGVGLLIFTWSFLGWCYEPVNDQENMSTAIEEHVNSTGVDNKKLMMWIFLGSDCLFFGSFISTYLVYRNRSLAGPYPNEILDIPITTVSTFVLLMSSLAMVLAVNYAQRGSQVLSLSLIHI